MTEFFLFATGFREALVPNRGSYPWVYILLPSRQSLEVNFHILK